MASSGQFSALDFITCAESAPARSHRWCADMLCPPHVPPQNVRSRPVMLQLLMGISLYLLCQVPTLYPPSTHPHMTPCIARAPTRCPTHDLPTPSLQNPQVCAESAVVYYSIEIFQMAGIATVRQTRRHKTCT